MGNEKLAVKEILTDQQKVRGISNTYADEILWQAGISPFSKSCAIPKHKIQQLHQIIWQLYKSHISQFNDSANGRFSGNINHLYMIHNPDKTISPTGGKILVDESRPSKTYFTNEQELFE